MAPVSESLIINFPHWEVLIIIIMQNNPYLNPSSYSNIHHDTACINEYTPVRNYAILITIFSIWEEKL